MVKSKEELLESISKILGDNNSDEAIQVLEDVSDTMDTLVDAEDWKTKYEENDKMWRDKYKARFTKTIKDDVIEGDNPDNFDNDNDGELEKTTFEELFKKEGEE